MTVDWRPERRVKPGDRYNRVMGIFSVDLSIAKPGGRASFVDVGSVMVNTGAEATWIAEPSLRKAGIPVRKKDQRFIMANGQEISRDIGYAMLRSGDFETV